MLNPYVIRKWAAFIIVGFFSVIAFFIGIKYYGLLIGLGCFMFSLIVSMIIANIMIKNPFSDLIEGKGLLILDINSTGIIKPFILGIAPPYIKGVKDGKPVEDVFNRAGVFMMRTPVKSANKVHNIPEGEKAGGVKMELSEDDYNRARFGMFQYPTLIYNSQLDSLVTKDFIGVTERETFAEHTILYLNHKMNELTSTLRDFGRYVVETLKPKGNIFQNKIFWIIVIIAACLLGALFLPQIIETVGGGAQVVSQNFNNAAQAAGQGGIITPK